LVGAARAAAGFGALSGQSATVSRPPGDRSTVTGERPRTRPPGRAPSGGWRRKPLGRNPATWWTVGVAAVVITALALFFLNGGGPGSPGRGSAPPPATMLYTLGTGVGQGGTLGELRPAEGVRGTATSPGWGADEGTL